MGRELVELVDGSGLGDEPALCGVFHLGVDCRCGDDLDGAEF